MNQIKEFINDESGQTSTEYILLVAVVAMIIFKLRGKLDSSLTKTVDQVFENVERMVEEIDRV